MASLLFAGDGFISSPFAILLTFVPIYNPAELVYNDRKRGNARPDKKFDFGNRIGSPHGKKAGTGLKNEKI
jgi:hypothetical protein